MHMFASIYTYVDRDWKIKLAYLLLIRIPSFYVFQWSLSIFAELGLQNSWKFHPFKYTSIAI